MNNSMLIGSIVGAIAVTALGSVAGYSYLDKGPQYAEVVSSKAVIERFSEPVEQCKDVVVQQKKAVKLHSKEAKRSRQGFSFSRKVTTSRASRMNFF